MHSTAPRKYETVLRVRSTFHTFRRSQNANPTRRTSLQPLPHYLNPQTLSTTPRPLRLPGKHDQNRSVSSPAPVVIVSSGEMAR